MSIRLRVIVVTVLLVAIAVAAADVTGFWLFKRYSYRTPIKTSTSSPPRQQRQYRTGRSSACPCFRAPCGRRWLSC